MLGERLFLALLCCFHDAQEVASPDVAQVGFAVALAQEAAGEVDEFGSGSEARHAAVAVEVGANADMFYASDVNGMVEVVDGIEDGCLSVGAQETVVEGDLCDAVMGCQRPQLVVGEVAWMVAEGSARRM